VQEDTPHIKQMIVEKKLVPSHCTKCYIRVVLCIIEDHGCCKPTVQLYWKCLHSVLGYPVHHSTYLPHPPDAAFSLYLHEPFQISLWFQISTQFQISTCF